MYSWTTPITEITGVGPASARALAKKKIKTVGDLLEYQPTGYYLPEITQMSEAKNGHHVIIWGRVEKVSPLHRGRGWAATLTDESGIMHATWFGLPFPPVREGQMVTAWGKYNKGYLSQPTCSTTDVSLLGISGGLYGKLTPVIRKALRVVFRDHEIEHVSDAHYVHLHDLHFPPSHEAFDRAVEWLKGHELLLLHLAMESRRKAARGEKGEPLEVLMGADELITPHFPYEIGRAHV